MFKNVLSILTLFSSIYLLMMTIHCLPTTTKPLSIKRGEQGSSIGIVKREFGSELNKRFLINKFRKRDGPKKYNLMLGSAPEPAPQSNPYWKPSSEPYWKPSSTPYWKPSSTPYWKPTKRDKDSPLYGQMLSVVVGTNEVGVSGSTKRSNEAKGEEKASI